MAIGDHLRLLADETRLRVLHLRAQLERHATASPFSVLRLGIERQIDGESARSRSVPAQFNAIAPALGEWWVKFERNRAWARALARADPKHESNRQRGANNRSHALGGPG